MNKIEEAVESYEEAKTVSDNIGFTLVQENARYGLARAYLLQNDLVNARVTIEAALRYDVPDNNHNVSALHGIIALRQGDEVAARGAFLRAIGQADEILSKTAEFYSALDARGLALCGLAILSYTDGTDDTEKSLKERKKKNPSNPCSPGTKKRQLKPSKRRARSLRMRGW